MDYPEEFVHQRAIEASFCLRGTVEGRQRRFPLRPGRNRVGRLPDSEISLEARFVSKRHADLILRTGGVQLADLASTNGTFVNGERVSVAVLAPGDRLAFGPVELQLEPMTSGDGELAMVIETRPSPRFCQAAPDKTSWVDLSTVEAAGDHRRWLALLGEVVELTDGGRRLDLAAPLAHLTTRLGAQAAALVELVEGTPVLLAGFGDFDRRPLDDPHLYRPPAAGARHRTFHTSTTDGAPFTWTVFRPCEGAPLALAMWGEFPGHRLSEDLFGAALRVFHRLRPAARRVPARSFGGHRLELFEGHVPGESAAMKTFYSQLAAMAAADLPVLILGETGVGKEGIARSLHLSSRRARGPFVAVNCAAIPGDLLEAELFGVTKGVATGVRPRQGRFLQAQGGTLLLDEVADMPAPLQAKLLRVLQEMQVEPLGGAAVDLDLRVVAATNTHVEERVAAGGFRRDLYYRLAGCVLEVPPLRERREDLPALVEQFLRAAAHEAGKSIQGITVAALRRLAQRSWPGNVRQLEHEVRRLVLHCPEGEAVTSEMVGEPPPPGARGVAGEAAAAAPATGSHEISPPASSAPAVASRRSLNAVELASLDLDAIEEQVVAEALRRAGGQRVRAARLLGISRTALYRRLKRHAADEGDRSD